MTSLMKTWNDYMKPADEREETEGDRAFKKPFWFLIAGIMVIAFYLMSYVQLMDVHHLDIMTEGVKAALSAIVSALFACMAIACIVVANTQQAKGIYYGSKFGHNASFPLGFTLAYSAGSAIVFSCALFAVRTIAEVQLVGFERAYLLANFLMRAAFGIFVFGFAVLALFLAWSQARKAAEALARELDD